MSRQSGLNCFHPMSTVQMDPQRRLFWLGQLVQTTLRLEDLLRQVLTVSELLVPVGPVEFELIVVPLYYSMYLNLYC